MGNFEDNSKKISSAFGRFLKRKDDLIRTGMYDLLESAVAYALDAHDEDHQNHFEMGDTYGWMLIHDGKVDAIVNMSSQGNEGRVSELLKRKIPKLPKNGWVGVVMAGMGRHYFAVDYEMSILQDTSSMTREKFTSYFREI